MNGNLALLAMFVMVPYSLAADFPSRLREPGQLPAEYHRLVEDLNKNAPFTAGPTIEVRLPTAEEIKEAGELWPTIPPAENAAFLWARAFANLTYLDEYPPGSASGTKPYGGQVEPLRTFVDGQSAAINFAKAAANMEEYHFPPLVSKEGDRGFGLHAPLPQFRQLARVTHDAAFAAEIEGRLDEAVELYLICVGMGKHLHQGRIIDGLVGQAVAVMGYGPLEHLVANHDLSRETLKRIENTCAACEIHPDELRQIVRTNLAATYWTYADQGWEELKKQYKDFPDTREQYFAAEASFTENLLKAVDVPLYVSLNEEYDLDSRLTEGIPRDSPMNHAFIGRGQLELMGRINADLRGLQIRAAINMYVQDNGRAPDSLEQLRPRYLKELPSDPFSGKDFLYKKDQDEWRLWSVGMNLKDDGGVYDESKSRWAQRTEIVFPDRLKTNEVRSRR